MGFCSMAAPAREVAMQPEPQSVEQPVVPKDDRNSRRSSVPTLPSPLMSLAQPTLSWADACAPARGHRVGAVGWGAGAAGLGPPTSHFTPTPKDTGLPPQQ